MGVARVEAKSLTSSSYPVKLYGDLIVKNDAELRIKPNRSYSLAAPGLVLEDDNIVVTPEGGTIPEGRGCLIDADGHDFRGEVVIGKLRTYSNYTVAGTQITNANQHAVLGDTTIVFLEPERLGGPGTLILNNANIEAGSEIGIGAKTLYLKLLGENNVSSTTRGLASKTAYIEGPGSLNISGQYGIDAHLSKLFISDGAKITAEGSTRYAIDGQETTISGKETVVRMKCSSDALGTFRASTSLTLEDGLKIEEPEGASFNGSDIVDADGNVIKDEWVTIQYTEAYNITVAGIGITNHNMNDVLGDGTVSYDPETNTLTLMNANITPAEDAGIRSTLSDLHIKLIGQNYITSEHMNVCIELNTVGVKGTIVFYGGGSLELKTKDTAFKTKHNLMLIDGVRVSAEGMYLYGIIGLNSKYSGHEDNYPSITMSGEGTMLMAKGGAYGSIANFSALVLNDGLEITQPAGATFVENVGVISDGSLVANEWVTIRKVNYHDIFIAGKQVTDLNQDDVMGDGTISYDPETNTLTLNGANIETETAEGITAFGDEINIRLEGENNITGQDGLYVVSANIEGPGSLYAKGEYYAIRPTSSLLISGGAQVTAEGISSSSFAICTTYMTVSGTETIVSMKGTLGTYSGFTPVLNDGLVIGLPIGAYYNSDTGRISNAAGEEIKDEWVIIASQDYIDGVSNVNANVNLNEGMYNLAGQKVGDGYKGSVIMNGRKVLVN